MKIYKYFLYYNHDNGQTVLEARDTLKDILLIQYEYAIETGIYIILENGERIYLR